MNKILRLSLVVVACLSIVMTTQSCGTKKEQAKNISESTGLANIDVDLAGTWVLKSLNGQNVNDIFKGKTPTMTLNFKENRVNGNGGCNTYGGMFSYKDGMFSTPNVAATMMACFQENKESDFFAMLAGPNSVKVINGVLTFMKDGQTAAEFVKGIDTGMLSGVWQLESIAGEDMKDLFTIEGRKATIEFDSTEGRIKGNAGCNGYGATYTINSTLIEIGAIMSTRMACPNLKGETKFTEALSGTSTISVSQDKITFSKDGKTTLTFVKEK